MAAAVTLAGDERRHEPGGEPLWSESWYFDFASPDASVGGYVRLGLLPGSERAWYWAYLVRAGEPVVVVRDHEVPLPRAKALEVRTEGLWSELTCEEPLLHWSVGLEAFGVALDDPADAYRGERGERTALGFDLEWEALSEAFPYAGVTRYEQPCGVHGEVLVGDQRIEIDGWGERDHSWGPRDWWAFGWCWSSGHFSDGSAFHAVRLAVDGVDPAPIFGFTLAPGAGRPAPIAAADVETDLGPEQLPTAARLVLTPAGDPAGDPARIEAVPVGHAPVLLTRDDGPTSRFPRALCRYAAEDGRFGVGWTEWLQLQRP